MQQRNINLCIDKEVTMARIKPKDKLPQLQSWDDVDLALCEIAEHMRVTESIQHKMQQVIDDAKPATRMRLQ